MSAASPSTDRSTGQADRLHAQIMNLPCKSPVGNPDFDYWYRVGHRDARHAAAELAMQSVAALLDERDRLRHACLAMLAWDDAEKNAKPYDDDNGAGFYARIAMCSEAFALARAALAGGEQSQSKGANHE